MTSENILSGHCILKCALIGVDLFGGQIDWGMRQEITSISLFMWQCQISQVLVIRGPSLQRHFLCQHSLLCAEKVSFQQHCLVPKMSRFMTGGISHCHDRTETTFDYTILTTCATEVFTVLDYIGSRPLDYGGYIICTHIRDACFIHGKDLF